MWSENFYSFLKTLKYKGFKEERITKIGLHDIRKSMPLEAIRAAPKSLQRDSRRPHEGDDFDDLDR